MKHSIFEVDKKKFTIEITDSGQFRSVVDGDSIGADTLDKLKAKIVRSQRLEKVRVALPATLAGRPRRHWTAEDGPQALIDIVITGIHQRNKSVLYRKVGGKEEAGTIDYNDVLLKRLTEDQKAEYLRLQKAKRDTEKSFEGYQNKFKYADHEIKQAVAKEQTAAGIEPEQED